MGTRNIKREQLRRIENKTLDARFTEIVRNGPNWSPFAAQAVLQVIHEVYHPFMDDAWGWCVSIWRSTGNWRRRQR